MNNVKTQRHTLNNDIQAKMKFKREANSVLVNVLHWFASCLYKINYQRCKLVMASSLWQNINTIKFLRTSIIQCINYCHTKYLSNNYG